MILLDLDPNIVKPGWTPFLITIGLAAVMYLLFRSMRRQFRRVDSNYPLDEPVSTDAPPVLDQTVDQASPATTPSEVAPPQSRRG